MSPFSCAAAGKRNPKKRSKDEYNNSYDSDRGCMDAGYRMAPYLPHSDGNNARPRSSLCHMSGPGAEGGKSGGHESRGGQGGADPGSGLGPPVVVQWRLGPQGLEMTVMLNNRMFSGLLGACRNSSSSGGSWSAAANAAAGRQGAGIDAAGGAAAGGAEPPHRGTRCTLCHKREEASVREQEGMQGMSYKGLGPLMAANMAGGGVLWIHRQCALWSPEVYMANGTLVSSGATVTLLWVSIVAWGLNAEAKTLLAANGKSAKKILASVILMLLPSSRGNVDRAAPTHV